MKPLALVLPAACLVLALAACGGSGAESAGPVPSAPVETGPAAASLAAREQPARPPVQGGARAGRSARPSRHARGPQSRPVLSTVESEPDCRSDVESERITKGDE
jgi:hypothetical protein